MTGANLPVIHPIISPEDLLNAREMVKQIYVDDKIKEYILDLVLTTREPGQNGLKDLNALISYGASPRASINLVIAARAHAFIKGRGFVTPEDIKQIAPDVLRHRIITSYEAEAENISSDHIVQRILDHTDVP
jgi:MoxR-like ATPase